MSDSLLDLESKTAMSVADAQNYIGGGTPHRKNVNREGGHRTYFLNRWIKGGDTAHQNLVTCSN